MLRTLVFYLLFIPATLVFSTLAALAPTERLARAAGRTWGRLALACTGARLDSDLSGLDPNAPYIFMANRSEEHTSELQSH